MADELFLNSLGNDFDPSIFEFTAGSGYADNRNHDAGKAISNAINGWFFGSVAHEYIGQAPLTLVPQGVSGRKRQYFGEIPLTLTPQAVFPRHYYTGNILLRLIPIAACSLLVPVVSLAVTGTGGVNVSGTGTIAFITPEVTTVIGSGGVEVAGEGTLAFEIPTTEIPTTLEVIGGGGAKVGGRGVIAFISEPPGIYAVIASGGVVIGSNGVTGFSFPDRTHDLAVVGAGGVEVGGAGIVGLGIPEALAVVGTGGVVVGGFRVPELTVVQFVDPADLTLIAVTTPVAIEMGGEGVFGFSKPSTFATPGPQAGESANILVGGGGCVAFITPQILELIGAGEIIVGREPEAEGTFDTLVLTGFRNEPSLYSNFNFNSYARYQGRYYGAKQDGVYLLEGEDDAGEEIHSGLRIGPANLGTDREKRLHLLRLGGECDQAQVKVSNGNGAAGYFDIDQGRVSVSRDIQGREITIEIADFESLNHLEIVPKVLARR